MNNRKPRRYRVTGGIMDYEDLVRGIKRQSITKLPALLIVIAEQCVEKNVFVPGGMELIIEHVINSHVSQRR